MTITFSNLAWENYLFWQGSDKKILKRVNLLIKDIVRSPYEGIGKPEPLKHGLSGYWSRRINDEHRIVYKVVDDSVLIAQLRYHYQQPDLINFHVMSGIYQRTGLMSTGAHCLHLKHKF